MIYIIVLLIFLFMFTLLTAVLFNIFNKEKPIEKLKYFDEDYEDKEKYENNKKNKTSILKGLSNLIPSSKNQNRVKKLEVELMKADIPITVEELLVIKIFSSSAFAFLGYALSRNYIIAVVIFAVIWNIPKLVINSRKKERVKLFDSQLSEGITIISNSLKAGYSFFQAIAVVTEETKDPFSKEFKKMIKEMSLGIPEEDSLRSLMKRMESEDLKLIINAILIQKDVGGNLSEILDNISETIRERQKIKNELKTLTAQGRLSGVIVMLIPVLLGGTIYLFNKEYIMLLFTTTAGIIMITVSVINQLIGFLIIRKIISIEM